MKIFEITDKCVTFFHVDYYLLNEFWDSGVSDPER